MFFGLLSSERRRAAGSHACVPGWTKLSKQHVIDLNDLATSRRADVDIMSQGIRGDAGSALWTAELRATNRGGKPCRITRVDEAAYDKA